MGYGYYKINGLTCPVCDSESGECACGEDYQDDGCGGYECAKGHYFTLEDILNKNIKQEADNGKGKES